MFVSYRLASFFSQISTFNSSWVPDLVLQKAWDTIFLMTGDYFLNPFSYDTCCICLALSKLAMLTWVCFKYSMFYTIFSVEWGDQILGFSVREGAQKRSNNFQREGRGGGGVVVELKFIWVKTTSEFHPSVYYQD